MAARDRWKCVSPGHYEHPVYGSIVREPEGRRNWRKIWWCYPPGQDGSEHWEPFLSYAKSYLIGLYEAGG